MLKKVIVFFSLFAFTVQINVPVFAQKKSGAKTKMRAASSERNVSATRTSSRRNLGTVKRNLGNTSSSSSSSSNNVAENCISQFTDCMDAQINGIIANYQYLADDPAVQAMQDTNDPLRCIYYNSSKVEGLFASDSRYCSSDLVANRKETVVDSKGNSSKKDSNSFNNMNVCSNQKDINELYLSYNYYCDLERSDVGVSGIPINKCNLKQTSGKNKNDVFATKDSYAYYNEANRRVSNGELKIINFEKTKLFKNKIEPLGLENWNHMSLTGKTCTYGDGENKGKICVEGSANCNCTDYESSVGDLLEDLGLTSDDNELFSINVVPPVGSGNLDAASQYDKARNICLGNSTFKLAGKKATDNENVIQSAINYLSKNCSDPATRMELERYYVAGTTVKLCDDDYVYNSAKDMCIYTGTDKDEVETEKAPHTSDEENVELEQTDFLSAKKSCDLFEQTLISTRNKAYADFDTQLKNYIDDEVAKLIKNKSKSMTTIANALNSVQKTDAQITIDNIQRKADVLTSKTEAEIAIMNAELDSTVKKAEASKKKLEVGNEMKSLILSNYERKILNACVTSASALITKLSSLKNPGDLFDLTVKATTEGDIKPEYNENGQLNADYTSLDSIKYQEFFCNELNGFDVSEMISSRVTFDACPSLTLASSGSIPMGIYKVILKGAGGGGGGGVYTVVKGKGEGGNGGKGGSIEKILLLSKAENYELSLGAGGSGGGGATLGHSGGNGGDGGDTTLTIMGTTYKADGGKGGQGAGKSGNYSDGSNGQTMGNGQGGSGGDGGPGGGKGKSKQKGDKGGDGSAEIYCVSSIKKS